MDINDVLPELSAEEYEALKASIAANGVEYPVIVDQNQDIIDGRQRRRVCEELGKRCETITRYVESETERLQLRLQLNCNRRHLTREQKRDMIATYLKIDPGIGNQVLGDIIGVSKNTVDSVRGELEQAGEIDHFEVLRGKDGKKRKRRRILANNEVEAGKAADIIDQLPEMDGIIPIRQAKRRVTMSRRRAEREDIAANATPWSHEDIKLYHCRFQDLTTSALIKPESVVLLITDPPYAKDWLPQWDELGEFARDTLTPGGILVTHTGIRYLPEAMAALGKSLTYQWTINMHWNGDSSRQYLGDGSVLTKWLPILVLSKGTPVVPLSFSDTLHVESKEKEYHDWQQPVEVFEKLVEYFSRPGDLVVDPCCGAFTTAVACYRLKRRCIACDIDEQSVKLGWARLHDERSGRSRRLPGQVLPARLVEDKPVACTCRPTPKPNDVRWSMIEVVKA